LLGETVAFAALLIAFFGALVEIYSIRAIDKRLQREHNWMEERGTAGEQFGQWLLYKENEKDPTNIEVLADTVVSRLGEHQRFSSMQEASVDARIQNKYDAKVMEALKKQVPIGYRLLMKVAEQLGFDLEEIISSDELGPFLRSLQKYNIPVMYGGEMGSEYPSRIKKSWEK